MWLKIKRYFEQITIPISVKLTILYSTILLGILIVTSVLTIGSIQHTLEKQAQNDIELSHKNVTSYLSAGNPLDQNLLKHNLLLAGVALMIYDRQGNLLFDSDPNFPGERGLRESEYAEERDQGDVDQPLNKDKLKRVRHLLMDHEGYYYQQVEGSGQRIFQYRIDMTAQSFFMKILSGSLVATNLIGLLIAVLSGMFISRKILQPIRQITNTAQAIEINNLDKRIDVRGSEDELKELAKTFNRMLDRIEAGINQQKQFVSNASHELRTPVTVVSGYADMLDRWGKNEPAVLNEGIVAIKSEASNMQNLIEKLLFLARADQSKQIVHKELLNIEQIIEAVFSDTLLIAPTHHIELANNEPAVIKADPSLIKEMLRIFIENSIKFTPSGGTISISSQKADNYLEISIKDTGIGIPEDEQAKIFDRFYRVDKSRTKATGGTGLGLSIAKWIADLHYSKISVASLPEKGTTMTVHLPLAES
jgi:signal transduction histidine kinase